MAEGKIMNLEELHFLGIKVVYKDLIDKGYEVLNVRKELDVNPQILAKKDDQFHMVLVKTGYYPEMGIILPDIIEQVKELGKKHHSECWYASVGIANANGTTEEEMAKPVVDGEYYINYQGLIPFPKDASAYTNSKE
ncbi:hypothetical protein [Plebeiibacterium sediminum]|uniref:Na(+)-translocating NADH-quinone reductase subunit F n=1 Tax=Plebeiibacterium sediminum TaxID=2992112 RepID=A0AAE3M7Q6_9BACT|nr:hypothetical protein [Plebeiobacterium sediminum]MCW3788719.1 hypothetical protein [Plebeiobacterium sediminum]